MHHRKNSSCPARPTRARTLAKRSTARARALQDPRGVVNLARCPNYIFCKWWLCLITNMRCWLQSWNGYRAQDAILVVNTGPSPCRPGTFNNEASEVGIIKLSRTNWAITKHFFSKVTSYHYSSGWRLPAMLVQRSNRRLPERRPQTDYRTSTSGGTSFGKMASSTPISTLAWLTTNLQGVFQLVEVSSRSRAAPRPIDANDFLKSLSTGQRLEVAVSTAASTIEMLKTDS